MPLTGLVVTLLRHLLIGALIWSCASVARAQMPDGISPGELARLPSYCPYTISWTVGGFPEGPLPQQRPWVQRLGVGFWATHHYCWALINANRAKLAGVTAAQRDHLHAKALDDVNYMLKNTPGNFPLRPELHVKAGEYLVELRRHAAAVEHFDHAAAIKPDYWPAYTRKAELFMSLGMWQQARDAVGAGLAVLPDEPQLKALAERLAQRGGSVRSRQQDVPAGNQSTSSASAASSPPRGLSGQPAVGVGKSP
jgi:hypothetical protein